MSLSKELLRSINNHQYEKHESGIYFPKAKLVFDNYFDISVNGDEPVVFPNLVVDEWRTRALEILFGAASKISTFYLAPYAANVSPGTGWTAANFTANATEFTNYTEATRQEWVVGAVSNYAISNSGNRATFTVGAGAQSTIWGVGLLSNSGKSATSGYLVAANKAAAARDNLVENDEVTIGYTVSLNDAS